MRRSPGLDAISWTPARSTAVAFIAIVVLGGVNGVAVRFSNRELDPLWGAGLRFTLQGTPGYLHNMRQRPARPSARPRILFFARRAIRVGLPEASTDRSFAMRAAEYSPDTKPRRLMTARLR